MTSFEAAVGDLGYMVNALGRKQKEVQSKRRAVGQIEMEIAAQFGTRLALAKAELKYAQNEAETLDDQTRQDGLEKWTQDPDHKRPHPAVGIRVNKVVEMDKNAALAYAMKLGKWLKLDLAKFKKDAKLELAKSDPDTALTAFAQIVEVPTATIAKDLSKYLEDEIAS
jgi:hypothetical protein